MIGDDFSSTASLVDAVLTLQEQREGRALSVNELLPRMPSSSDASRVETAGEPRVSVADSDRDETASAPAAGLSAC